MVSASQQPPAPEAGAGSRSQAYYIGVVLGIIGVVLAPYVFVFVALPEAILQFWGRSIQDSLDPDARNNAYLSGSFLIIRWFGNGCLLLLILGAAVLLFLIL